MVNHMDFTKATNKQLITIMNYDRDCPIELLREVITEMINREILVNFIVYHSKRFFGSLADGQVKTWLEKSDIIQLGYIGILKALNKYQEGKSTFATFSQYYMNTEWQNHLRKFTSIKRTADREQVSMDVVVNEHGNTLEEFLPSMEDVEKTVLMKVYFETQLALLTPLQKTAVLGYLEGYEMKELGQILHVKRQSIERAFHRAVEKMGGENFSLKGNSGMRKGA